MTDDDPRTRAEAASLKRAPRHHIFESSNANAHYRAGFMDGALWHASTLPTVDEVAQAIRVADGDHTMGAGQLAEVVHDLFVK